MGLLSGGGQYETRYAKTPDGVYIAYQTVGDGPMDLAYSFNFFGNVDVVWEMPTMSYLLHGLASFSRLILYDRRGTGLSSRNVPPANLETRVADLREVLDALDCTSVVLDGANEAGGLNTLFAAAYPDRVRALVWWNPLARSVWAPDYPWGAGSDYLERSQQSILESWETEAYGAAFAETEEVVGHKLSSSQSRIMGKLSRPPPLPTLQSSLDGSGMRQTSETSSRLSAPHRC